MLDTKRFILTGAPGSGKTTIIHALEAQGFAVIPEAATDIIAKEQLKGTLEPWKHPDFIDAIMTLQKKRQLDAESLDVKLQFYDRSPICTYALALYLKTEPSNILLQEIERIEKRKTYQKTVFFIENLGFCTPTGARKISFEESLLFEKIHEETYAHFGYTCIRIPIASTIERANTILAYIDAT